MTEPNQDPQAHWQAIWQQLGLEPDPAPPPPAASPPSRKAPVESERVLETLPAIEKPATVVRATPPPPEEEPVPPRGRRRRPADNVEERPPMPPVSAEGPVQDSPRRGRSSGRRGHSPDKEAPGRRQRGRRPSQGRAEASDEPEGVDSVAAVTAPDAGTSEPFPEQPQGRGRGRSRRPPGKHAPDRDDESASAEVLETPRPSNPDDDAEAEEDARAMSEWNVPSWNELIASLYRPER